MAAMGRLLLLRHAQSEWNAAGRWQGWSDAPLSALGQSQAREAGAVLAAQSVVPALVASSDLQRARSTAALVAEQLGYDDPLHIEPDLREHDVGQWNGLTTDQINARWPGDVEALGARTLQGFPGGEQLAAFADRVRRGALRLAHLAYERAAGDVIVVSHGGALTAVEQWLGIWRRERRHPNLSGWWLAVTGSPPELGLRPVLAVQLLGVAPTPGAEGAAPGAAPAAPPAPTGDAENDDTVTEVA
jgi:broad specificity phosphatase PhoE